MDGTGQDGFIYINSIGSAQALALSADLSLRAWLLVSCVEPRSSAEACQRTGQGQVRYMSSPPTFTCVTIGF